MNYKEQIYIINQAESGVRLMKRALKEHRLFQHEETWFKCEPHPMFNFAFYEYKIIPEPRSWVLLMHKKTRVLHALAVGESYTPDDYDDFTIKVNEELMEIPDDISKTR